MAARARDTMTTAPQRKWIMYMLVLAKMTMPKLVMRFKENNEIFKDGTVKGCVVGIRCPYQTQG